MIYIGCDNGVTSSISMINDENGKIDFFKIPVFQTDNYQTSKKSRITRVDTNELYARISSNPDFKINCTKTVALCERPLSNPRLYTASLSAMRSLEALLIVLERSNIEYRFIDSKIWQGKYLQVKGREELKRSSKELGSKLWPEFIGVHDDYDGMFIAKYLSEHYEELFIRQEKKMKRSHIRQRI